MALNADLVFSASVFMIITDCILFHLSVLYRYFFQSDPCINCEAGSICNQRKSKAAEHCLILFYCSFCLDTKRTKKVKADGKMLKLSHAIDAKNNSTPSQTDFLHLFNACSSFLMHFSIGRFIKAKGHFIVIPIL